MLVDFGLAQNMEKSTDTAALLAAERLQRTNSSHSASSEPPSSKRKSHSNLLGIAGYDSRESRRRAPACRAGTRGFRAPEVLLQCTEQTSAIDVWAAGVIMLSIFSGRYPFFDSPDDGTALGELISIFGSDALKTASSKLGKELLCQPEQPANSLREICRRFRSAPPPLKAKERSKKFRKTTADKNEANEANETNEKSEKSEKKRRKDRKERGGSSVKSPPVLPDEAYDLMEQCLRLDPSQRISARDALQHPFLITSDSDDSADEGDQTERGVQA
eukprot:Opistho-2@3615